MTTALQLAKLKACTTLLEMKEKVLETRSYICWEDAEVHTIDKLINQLDALLAKVLP